MSSDPVAPVSANRPLRWIITVYVILALTAFAYPAGLRDWLEERDAGGRLWLPLAIARPIDRASAAVGVKPIGEDLKRRFSRLIGDPDS